MWLGKFVDVLDVWFAAIWSLRQGLLHPLRSWNKFILVVRVEGQGLGRAGFGEDRV